MTATAPPQAHSDRLASGKFKAGVADPLAITKAVGEVLRHCQATSHIPAAKTSQAAFDRARSAAGHSDLSKARVLCRRLDVKWPKLKSIALAPRSQHEFLLGTAAARGRRGLTLEACIAAVQIIARVLGRSPTMPAYREERDARVAADERAWRHGGYADHTLPSVNQITEILKQHDMTWTDLIKRAELPPATERRARGMSAEEAAPLFAADMGGWPKGTGHLKPWARHRGLPLQALPEADIKAGIARARETAKAAGHPELPTVGAKPGEIPFDLSKVPAGTRERSMKDWETKAEIVAGLARAMTLLEPGRTLTQDRLNQTAKDHPAQRIPAYSSVQRRMNLDGGTWDGWKDEAAALVKAGTVPAP